MWGLFKRVLCGVPACAGQPQTLTPPPATASSRRGGAATARDAERQAGAGREPEPAGPCPGSAGAPFGSPVAAVGAPAGSPPRSPAAGGPAPALLALTPLPAAAPATPAAKAAGAGATPEASDCRTPDQCGGAAGPAGALGSQARAPRSGSVRSSAVSSGFLMEGGRPVGLVNSTSKYHPSRPLAPHVSPAAAAPHAGRALGGKRGRRRKARPHGNTALHVDAARPQHMVPMHEPPVAAPGDALRAPRRAQAGGGGGGRAAGLVRSRGGREPAGRVAAAPPPVFLSLASRRMARSVHSCGPASLSLL
jgi:hypothetical protein